MSRMRGATRPLASSEVLDDLLELHRARPGITEETLGALRDRAGKNGYELLARVVPDAAGDVVDLGCGNGPLIAALTGNSGLRAIHGVDACAPEIDRARSRFERDARVRLHVAMAQQLPFADASVDCVLSHHAFYLFEPIEAAVEEVARVLRPGGLFAFVTTSFRPSDDFPVLARMMRDFGEHTKRENPHFTGWGDRRVWSREGLASLLGGAFTAIEIEEHVLAIREPIDAIVDRMARFFYSFELQSPAMQDETRRSWRDALAATLDENGLATLQWPTAIVSARRL